MENPKQFFSVEGKFDRYGEVTQFFVGVYSREDWSVEAAVNAAEIFRHGVSQDIGAAKWVEKDEIEHYNKMGLGRKLHSALRWEGRMGSAQVYFEAYLEICIFEITVDKIPETIDDFLDLDKISEREAICEKT